MAIKNTRYLSTLPLLLLASLAQAATEASKSATDYLIQIGLPLLMIVSLIIGFGFLAKRLNLHRLNNKGPVKVISSTPISGQVKLCLIDVEGKQMLISVSNQQANCLHVFESPVVASAEPTTATKDFATLFSLAVKKPSQKKVRSGETSCP